MKLKIYRIGERAVYLFGPLLQYLWQCFNSAIKYTITRVKKVAAGLILIALGWLGILMFEHFVQPALISIHPMFADQPAASADMGRRADSPAKFALYATIFITITTAYSLKLGIKEAFNSGISVGVAEFILVAVLAPLLPYLPALIALGEVAVAILPAWMLPGGYGENNLLQS